jgi:hypothetical protein
VVHLRWQLQAMTAERDRLLAELAQGGDAQEGAPLFLMDAPGPQGGAPHADPRPALQLPPPASHGPLSRRR